MNHPPLAPSIASQLAGVFDLAWPETLLVLVACVLFLGATFRSNRHFWGGIALAALVLAGGLLWSTVQQRPVRPPDGVLPLSFDAFAVFIKVVALVGGVVLVLFSWDEVSDALAAEYYACLLIIIAGLMLTGAANDLVVLFLALELISIPTYVILYLQRTDRAAQEAAVKYFLLSVFSTAILLFGFSYLYGLSGTTNLVSMVDALTHTAETDAGRLPLLPVLALVALVMVVAGLGFKITAVPFHFYAPDVYEGTSLTSAALLAFVPKVAGFVSFFRLLDFILPQRGPTPGLALGAQATILFWILATMTMTVGNILALLQDNLKRLLAYSSVAHAGYMLIGLAVAPKLAGQDVVGGVEAILFYLVSYGAMTIGAFAVLAYLSTPEHPVDTVDDLAGISRSHPGIALLMALFLFSLIGMPMTAGFLGKFFLFFGALAVPVDQARLFYGLVLIGALNAAVGAWYYLRIIAAMYLRTPIRPIEKPRAWPNLVALWICASLTLGLGIYPQPLVKATRTAVGGTANQVSQREGENVLPAVAAND